MRGKAGLIPGMLVLAFAAGVVACGSGSAASRGTPGVSTPAAATSDGAAHPSSSAASVLSGAEASERTSPSLRVAAASDLRGVMETIRPRIEEVCRTRVTVVFGSSGVLTTQIRAGADFALLLSADSQYPADLRNAGKVVPNGIASYGVGRIAIGLEDGLRRTLPWYQTLLGTR